MISIALGFDDNDAIEDKIMALKNKRKQLGEKIEKLEMKYPRCPHCEKRYFIDKYSVLTDTLGIVNIEDDAVQVRCPLGHKLMIRLWGRRPVAASEWIDIITEGIEDLDYGYMD